METKRHVEPGQHISQLVRGAVHGTPDNAEQLKASLLILSPFGQEPAHFAVEILLQHPRLADVKVGLASVIARTTGLRAE